LLAANGSLRNNPLYNFQLSAVPLIVACAGTKIRF